MAISSVMNASTVSSISPPISNRVAPTARASLHSFFAAYGSLRSTVTLHNHSSGASMAPTLGYLSTPCPLLPPASTSPALRVLCAHKEQPGKEIPDYSPRSFPALAYTRFQPVQINIYRPKHLCVASCVTMSERIFLLESCRDNVLQVSSHVH